MTPARRLDFHKEVDVSERPDVKAAARQLFERVQALCQYDKASGSHFGQTFENIKTLVKEHRRSNRYRGIPFPELTVLALPQQGGIELLRTDLDEKSMQVLVVNLTQKYPQVTPMELATAIHEAFPAYRSNAANVNFELRRKQPTVESVQ